MRTATLIASVATFLLLLALTGCRQEQQPADSLDAGKVEANQAYLQHFGNPPHGKEGRAFARVGYLPLRTDPDKLRALPLFLFSENDQLQAILDRLTGDALILPPESDLYQPVPDEIEISTAPVESGVLTLAMTSRQTWSEADQAAAGRALAETALQFAEVERVRVLINGEALSQMPANGYTHDPQQLVEVGPPALVMMVGHWEEGEHGEDGAAELKEILIEFDRPVEINSFQLHDANGIAVAGDYFTSVMQMAVVVHPQHPQNYREGTELRADWDVIDDLSRASRGSRSLPLRRVGH